MSFTQKNYTKKKEKKKKKKKEETGDFSVEAFYFLRGGQLEKQKPNLYMNTHVQMVKYRNNWGSVWIQLYIYLLLI